MSECKRPTKFIFVPVMLHAHIFVATLVIAFTLTANAVDFDQCLQTINNMTIDGKTDNHGHPLPPSANATAITYELCVSQCGAGQEPFQWEMSSQQFSSWLLPWLALVSQLPFGAYARLDNLESMLLTVGSPTLAAYSLVLTLLNGQWIAQLFSNHEYSNAQSVVQILSSLQQSPLRVDPDKARLKSLMVLPQNDEWWTELTVWLDYTHTWSISAVASIAWVIIAFIFTIVDYFSDSVLVTLDTNEQGVASIGCLWLWLLPIVVGWLLVSPKCDYNRLIQATNRANALDYVATSTGPPIKASSTKKHAISLKFSSIADDRRDESSTPPIFNYARSLHWVKDVLVVFDEFHNLSERTPHHDPSNPTAEWGDRDTFEMIPLATASEMEQYSQYVRPKRKWGGLDDSVSSRIFIASAMALMLQWGTTGAAVVMVWFTPTVGLGCRSAGYIAYGVLSTLVWIMLVTSSILTYYSTNTPAHSRNGKPAPLQFRIASWLSIFLRRSGKLVAAVNAVWIVLSGMFQFGSVFDRCFCNSSVFGLGKGAYNVIDLTQADAINMRSAWMGGFTLAASTAAIFSGYVALLLPPTS